MKIEVKPTDKLFEDSPDYGTPECICSRCGEVITEQQAPAIRIWPKSEDGDLLGSEYRYHIECLEEVTAPADDAMDHSKYDYE